MFKPATVVITPLSVTAVAVLFELEFAIFTGAAPVKSTAAFVLLVITVEFTRFKLPVLVVFKNPNPLDLILEFATIASLAALYTPADPPNTRLQLDMIVLPKPLFDILLSAVPSFAITFCSVVTPLAVFEQSDPLKDPEINPEKTALPLLDINAFTVFADPK